MTGVPKDQLEQLAQLYAIRTRKSSPTGRWASTSIPVVVGQQPGLQPAPADRQNFPAGCGPFSLTGQPSACGTAREVAPLLTVCLRTWW